MTASPLTDPAPAALPPGFCWLFDGSEPPETVFARWVMAGPGRFDKVRRMLVARPQRDHGVLFYAAQRFEDLNTDRRGGRGRSIQRRTRRTCVQPDRRDLQGHALGLRRRRAALHERAATRGAAVASLPDRRHRPRGHGLAERRAGDEVPARSERNAPRQSAQRRSRFRLRRNPGAHRGRCVREHRNSRIALSLRPHTPPMR